MGVAVLLLTMLVARFADVSFLDIAHLDPAATHAKSMISGPDVPPLDNIGHPENHLSQHWSIAAATVEFGQNPLPESAFLPAEILLDGRNDAPSIPPPLV